MRKDHELPIRLAIRREGGMVSAYLATKDTMTGAMLLGSIAMGIAEREDFFARWKEIMEEALKIAVRRVFGETPDLIEHPVPEHERAGNA